MDFTALNRRIADVFPRLSPQLRRAARHVLDRPDDVALMSMRRQAASAGVHPSTMVRLARAFDFRGYNEFRAPFQQRLRDRPADYLARARDLQARGAGGEAAGLMAEIVEADVANLRQTFETNGIERFTACAETLARGQRIYVAGLRSCYPVAFFFHYACGLFRDNLILLDGRGGTFADSLRSFGPGDVMFAVSVEPYTHEIVTAVAYAKDHGGASVVLTDSLASPLARDADHVLIVDNDSPSFFSSIAATVAVAETLVVLMVAQGGERALSSIEESEGQLARFDAYWRHRPGKSGGAPDKDADR